MRTANNATARLLLALTFSCVAASVCAAQRLPQVTKVEPPNWWAGHTINPVRVMLHGQNLSGARVEAVGSGVKAGLVRANDAGTYLFVDVFIQRDAKPGLRAWRVTTWAEAADANFKVSEPLP